MSKVTSRNVMEVNNGQAHLDAALRIVGSVSQCHVFSLYDFIFNVLFHCVSCVSFVAEHSLLEVAPQKYNRRR
jgi:hypothetical protein